MTQIAKLIFKNNFCELKELMEGEEKRIFYIQNPESSARSRMPLASISNSRTRLLRFMPLRKAGSMLWKSSQSPESPVLVTSDSSSATLSEADPGS